MPHDLTLRLSPALVLLVALLSAGDSRADWLESTLLQPVEESEHVVRGTVRDGVLHAKVRRTFVNAGDIPDEVVMSVDVPSGASAVGLRLRAGTKWFEGELLDADEADDRYQTLTGLGAAEPRDPVLLQWASASRLMMQVFPVFPDGRPATVEYDLAVPLAWREGAWVTEWPLTEDDALLADVRFELDAPGADLSVEAGAIRVAPRDRRSVVARLGAASATLEAHLARLDVEAPAQLSRVPVAPSVVFVVDGSWSVREEDLQAQLALARGWLAHTPDARFEVVAYSRDARSLAGGLRPASEADRWLDLGRVPRANGSDVASGMRRAFDALAGVSGPRRVIVFSDALLASRNGLASAVEATRDARGPLVLHVVLAESAAPEEPERDDEHELAAVARPFGGILVHAVGTPEAEREDLAAAMLPLVRPVRIEHLSIDGLPEDLAVMAPEVLEEGAGFGLFDRVDARPRRVTLKGQTWSSPWTLEVTPDADRGVLVAGWAFGEGLTDDLPREAQLALAKEGRAVSPVTSYLAIEPGAQPNKAGIPDRLRSATGFGLGGTGSASCGLGYASVVRPVGPERTLQEQAAEALAACGPVEAPVTIEVETTRDEIVDVVALGPMTERVRCLEEALWAHRVDPGWDRFQRRQVAVLVR